MRTYISKIVISTIMLIFLISITGCFLLNDNIGNKIFSDTSNDNSIIDSSASTESIDANSTDSNLVTVPITKKEIDKIVAYIEFVSLYEGITLFDEIENVDYSQLVSRFFYMAQTIEGTQLDESYEGRIAATLESVQEVIRTHVNPNITLPKNYDYQLDESLVVWFQEKQAFGWYGRGLPMNREIIYPLQAYSDSEGTITFRCIDLTTTSMEVYEENLILEVYDKDNNVIGTFDEYNHVFEFNVDISTLPVSTYTLERNGDNDYYLISKIQE